MEVKPGYKQTEVGVIPEEWGGEASRSGRHRTEEWVNLTQLANMAMGHSHPQRPWGTSFLNWNRITAAWMRRLS